MLRGLCRCMVCPVILTGSKVTPEGPCGARKAPFIGKPLSYRCLMDPITGLIAGGASLLGSFFSNSTSASNTQAQIAAQQQMQGQTEQFNAGQAQIARDYNTQMSNTAYQRASADMKDAGLNPMMMFGSGSAASTPSSPTASVGTPSVPVSQSKGAFAGIGDAVSRGLDAMVSAKTVDRMSSEIADLKSSALKKDAETKTEAERPDLVKAEASTEREKASNVAQSTTALKLDRARQEWDAIKYLDLSGIPDAARKTGNIGAWGAGKAADVLAPLVSGATGMYRYNHW